MHSERILQAAIKAAKQQLPTASAYPRIGQQQAETMAGGYQRGVDDLLGAIRLQLIAVGEADQIDATIDRFEESMRSAAAECGNDHLRKQLFGTLAASCEAAKGDREATMIRT